MINIVGLGYGEIENLTAAALKKLETSEVIFIKECKKILEKKINHKNIHYINYDYLYNSIEDSHKVNEKIAENLISKYKNNMDFVYAVPGNPVEESGDVYELIKKCKERKIEYKIYPAIGINSFVSKVFQKEIDNVKIINSEKVDDSIFNKREDIAIINILNKTALSYVKKVLLRVYSEEVEIYCLNKYDDKYIEKVKVGEIDKIKEIDCYTVFFIPKELDGKKDIYELMRIIEILRGKNGCPWDREQTHKSIKKSIIEESYEVCDAIEKNDETSLIEELGDVLLQIVFHASIGKQNEEFNILDITDGICNKMIYRHPHVFGNENVKDTAEVLMNWDELKNKEKNFKSITDELNGVAKALPALIRAKKIQSKAKKVGFDWDNVEGAIEKVREELNEVIDVYKSEKMSRIKEEIGDLLFSCVNVSRFLNVDAEEALNLTTNKFIRRFNYMEEMARENDLNLEEMSLNDMDKLWDEAKKSEKHYSREGI